MSYYTGKKELNEMRIKILNKSIHYEDVKPLMTKDEATWYNQGLLDASKVVELYIPHNCKSSATYTNRR